MVGQTRLPSEKSGSQAIEMNCKKAATQIGAVLNALNLPKPQKRVNNKSLPMF